MLLNTKYQPNGFSLLEILVALSIISVMLMIAIPLYSDYVTRTKVSEGTSIVTNVLLRVEETYRETGYWPRNNDEAGVGEPENFATTWVKQVIVSHDEAGISQVRVVYNHATLGGNIPENTDIIFNPESGAYVTKWTCLNGSLQSYYRPLHCRDET